MHAILKVHAHFEWLSINIFLDFDNQIPINYTFFQTNERTNGLKRREEEMNNYTDNHNHDHKL